MSREALERRLRDTICCCTNKIGFHLCDMQARRVAELFDRPALEAKVAEALRRSYDNPGHVDRDLDERVKRINAESVARIALDAIFGEEAKPSYGCDVEGHPTNFTHRCPGEEAKPATHTRTATELGPDYCYECSSAITDWVPWPCPAELKEEVGEEACPACEGDGEVAVGFGIQSIGRPLIETCPTCGGKGRTP